jgi:hypothetical protein
MCNGTTYNPNFVRKHTYGRRVVLYAPYRIRTDIGNKRTPGKFITDSSCSRNTPGYMAESGPGEGSRYSDLLRAGCSRGSNTGGGVIFRTRSDRP